MGQTAQFEDKRWASGVQPLVFRHEAALGYLKSGTKLLDVACGDGLFLAMAKEKGLDVWGVDISEQGLENTRARGIERVSRCDVTSEPLPFAEDEFDYVSALDVLEHTLEPERMMYEIKRVTKEFVVISVPNFSALPGRLQCLVGKVPENNRPKKGHSYWFNWPILKSMLQKSGLEIVEVKQNCQLMDVGLVGNITRFLAKSWPNLFALSFVVLARKKRAA